MQQESLAISWTKDETLVIVQFSWPNLMLKFSSVSSCPCRQVLGVTESKSDEGLSALGKNASRISGSEGSLMWPVQGITSSDV